MKCDRLISLVKNWYLKVQEEAMAPARMVAFMEQHIVQCEECLSDPDVKQEVDKIREIVLPPSKVPKPKVVRAAKPETEEAEDAKEVDTSKDDDDDEDIDSDEDDTEDSVDDDDEDDEDDDEDDEDDFDPDIIDDDEI